MGYTYNRKNKPDFKTANFVKLEPGQSYMGTVCFASNYIDDRSQFGPRDRMTLAFQNGDVIRSTAKSFIREAEAVLEGRVSSTGTFASFPVVILATPDSFTDSNSGETVNYTKYTIRAI